MEKQAKINVMSAIIILFKGKLNLGKLYAKEMDNLAATYEWAVKANIDELLEAVSGLADSPLVATGSGGSLSAAHIAASLHEAYAGAVAKAVTPLELTTSNLRQKRATILFVSAGGRNVDVLKAFRAMAAREPQRILVLCSDKTSPLSRLAGEHSFVNSINFKLPFGKDGFLATNSLLAFSILMYRAWATIYINEAELPPDLPSLIYPNESEVGYLKRLREIGETLWQKETISILYSPQIKAAAIDFESKFTEAALGSVQIADYRNFAHGRHHWLAKRADETAVAAFVTDEDRELATKTLRLLPPQIAISTINLPFTGPVGMLSALVQVFHLTGLAGEKRGIDPGRPGVPDFGRKIYHLRKFEIKTNGTCGLKPFEKVVIERKTGNSVARLVHSDDLKFWKTALNNFIEKIESSLFQGIVFDFDGTLCDRRERLTGISDQIAEHLVELAENDIKIGVATESKKKQGRFLII